MPTYSKEEISNALKLYDEEKNATRVVRKLGYPTTATLYIWLRQRNPKSKHAKQTITNDGNRINNYSYKDRKRFSPYEKLSVLKRCFEDGEDVRFVAEEVGVSRQSIHQWRKIVEMRGIVGLMNKDKKKLIDLKLKAEPKVVKQDTQTKEINSLKQEIITLKMEIDILKEALDLIKKDKGIGYLKLKNSEKIQLINALREDYTLKDLLVRLNIPKSSYYYHIKKLENHDKYEYLCLKIKEIYELNRCVYGYRRIKISLNNQGIIVSEKVIRRLMKQKELIPKYKKKARKYSSYQGEISEAPDNIINRDFKSDYPNQKWLTDITEFALSNEKVYLSSIVDCFDGKIISWNTSTRPDAQLADESLIDACKTLKKTDNVILHSDRGGHYRWNNWINITKEHNIIRSMSKKGCTGDNAACEGVFGHIKNECFYGLDFRDINAEEFIEYLNNYLVWFNETRIKTKFACSINENRQKYGY